MTASLSALPGLKTGTFAAFMSRRSPVRGLRPTLAARSRTVKVPNPISVTLSASASASLILSITASTALPACPLVISADSATAWINSDLFIYPPLKIG
ncbi:hypothetical protein BGP_0986 [Beggiatoa sp. PS]|nr:hypothetical protein BGP_0986 [Beggiatoa sp. PS]